MTKPKIHSSTFVHKGYFDVRQDVLEKENGIQGTYSSVLLCPFATVVLAQDENQNWILNREYRHPTGEYILGCPGGRLEEGEDPLEGARREFLEETGYLAKNMYQIGLAYPLPSLCNQKIYFFYAKDAVKSKERALEPFEFIETELKSDIDLRKEILKGEKVDSLLCTALWYKDHFSLRSDLC